MTHYLLNYLDVRLIFAKPCAKRMAKNVATEMRDDNGFSIFFLSFLLFLFVAPSCYCVDCSVNCLWGVRQPHILHKLSVTLQFKKLFLNAHDQLRHRPTNRIKGRKAGILISISTFSGIPSLSSMISPVTGSTLSCSFLWYKRQGLGIMKR